MVHRLTLLQGSNALTQAAKMQALVEGATFVRPRYGSLSVCVSFYVSVYVCMCLCVCVCVCVCVTL
jgi:hypothetical protein